MMPRKVVVDTDVILEHLTLSGRGTKSVLRRAMSKYFCYTTVFNVIELFGICENWREIRAVEDVLGAVKILGLNGRSGKTLGLVVRRARRMKLRDFDALIGGLCVESRLPLLTGRPENYRSIRLLRLVRASEISGT